MSSLQRSEKNYTVDDIIVLERWLDEYVTNWASCDTFCNHPIERYIESLILTSTDIALNNILIMGDPYVYSTSDGS